MNPVAVMLLLVALLSSACGAATEHSTEVAQVRSGSLDIVLLAGQAALGTGKDTSTLEFRSTSDRSLVDVGTVKATATMSMAGMAPMSGGASVERTNTPGRYRVTSDLGMTGQWRLVVEWNGPAGSGSANFSPMVQ
jgi:hypothetical protein